MQVFKPLSIKEIDNIYLNYPFDFITKDLFNGTIYTVPIYLAITFKPYCILFPFSDTTLKSAHITLL